MDCAECTQHVQHAIAGLSGVESVNVFLASEKAVIRLDPSRIEMPAIRKAVADAGYSILENQGAKTQTEEGMAADFTKRILTLFAVVFGFVLFVVVAGEWLGLLERLTEHLPFWLGAVLVILAGSPIFRNIIRSALHRQITSHMLMSLGVLAALAVGQWATAAVVVCFMYVGEYVEAFTTERARRAVKNLAALAPMSARVERGGQEIEVPIEEVRTGDVVIVRPGDKIPVDGQVIDGQATVNQAALTGESMPVEVSVGANVFAATIAQFGGLRVRAMHTGADTTFGHVIKLVEEAEANRADVQRFADKFTVYYLPIVAGVAAITFLISRNPLATAAVLVVACSCSIALATPIAMLASVGAAAQRGLLIKGGKYLEALARADVVLVDKTGTLTLGKPQVTDVVSLNGIDETELLTIAASAERDSEHPLAEAVRNAATEKNLALVPPRDFQAVPGMGIRAQVKDKSVVVGNRSLISGATRAARGHFAQRNNELESQGKTLLFVAVQGELVGVLAASDTLRAEVPEALKQLRTLGVKKIELLTGDNERTASALAQQLGVDLRANLLPQDKIAIVKEYQKKGHTVVMVGDGVNDAPALAQANVGSAMGAAHVALLRDDWLLVPDVFRIAQRTMRVVKRNLAFTALYNTVGLSLAAFGILPPILAAAAQSLPDLGILANSSRLLRQR